VYLVQPHTLLHVRCCGFEIFKCPEVVLLGATMALIVDG
jgi:hypothetical protein